LRDQAREFFGKRFTIVFVFFGSDVEAWGENETAFFDFTCITCLAEAPLVPVDPFALLVLLPPRGRGLAAPLTESIHTATDGGGWGQVAVDELAIGQYAQRAGLHRAEFSGVDEEGLPLAVAAAMLEVLAALVPREEPKTDRDTGRVEQLGR